MQKYLEMIETLKGQLAVIEKQTGKFDGMPNISPKAILGFKIVGGASIVMLIMTFVLLHLWLIN